MPSISKTKREKGGFTLIELLIVVAIIAIIAAAVIIVINPGEQFQDARNSARLSHMTAIANGLYLHALNDEGGFYDDCIGSATATDVDEENCGALVPEYLPTFPEDPQTGGSYQVKYLEGSNESRLKVTTDPDVTDAGTPTVIQ